MYLHKYGTTDLPPAPPPKPNSQDISRQGTPASGHDPSPPPPPLSEQKAEAHVQQQQQQQHQHQHQHQQQDEEEEEEEKEEVRGSAAGNDTERVRDPGDRWLPKLLQDKTYGASFPHKERVREYEIATNRHAGSRTSPRPCKIQRY